jgi:hypothetical protein
MWNSSIHIFNINPVFLYLWGNVYQCEFEPGKGDGWGEEEDKEVEDNSVCGILGDIEPDYMCDYDDI